MLKRGFVSVVGRGVICDGNRSAAATPNREKQLHTVAYLLLLLNNANVVESMKTSLLSSSSNIIHIKGLEWREVPVSSSSFLTSMDGLF